MHEKASTLIAGASGQVGRQVVRALLERKAPVRILVRNTERKESLPVGAEVAVGDFDDSKSLDAALAGIARLFVVCSPTADLPRLEGRVYEAARRAGVELVVKSSILGADPKAIPFRAIQGEAERSLAASGLAHVVLQPNYFMQNVLSAAKTVASQNVYEDAAGGARLSMVDLRDVGDAAAAVLCGDGHHGKTYQLTGPEALSGEDVARLAREVTGHAVMAVDLDPAEQRRRLAKYGVPEWLNAALESLYLDYRASGATGYAARVTSDVSQLTSRPPRSLAALLRENTAAFQST
jgi:uncharacterized protein YbjT (DUF2867 family)